MLDIALCIILLHTAAVGVPWIYALNVAIALAIASLLMPIAA